MDLQSLIDQPGKLPTIPKVAQQLIASFSAQDVSVGAVAEQIALDPALTARLLRLANSAYFHVSRSIGTVEAALQMLGFVMVRNLVLGSSMAGAFKHVPNVDLPQFWRHNLVAACASRWLARRVDLNADLVFTLALLHRIGQLHMQVLMPQALLPLNRQMPLLDGRRAGLEQQAFGFHFGQVSAALAQHWNYPRPLVEALQRVEQPLEGEPFSAAAAVVHLGVWRARVEVLGFAAADPAVAYPLAVVQRLPGLAAHAMSAADLLHKMPPAADLTQGLDAMFE